MYSSERKIDGYLKHSYYNNIDEMFWHFLLF